jgi:hypothetical protein
MSRDLLGLPQQNALSLQRAALRNLARAQAMTMRISGNKHSSRG